MMKQKLGTKAQAGAGLLTGIGVLVAGAAMLYIGMYVNAIMYDTTNSSVTANSTAKATLDDTKSRVDTAFKLMGIVFIVLGAAMIIGVLRSGLA